MPNGPVHVGTGGLVGAFTAAALASEQDNGDGAFIGGGLVGALAGPLPDALEPALNPNHRGICHGWACAALIAYGMYQAYRWEPADEWGRFFRWLGLIGGAAYLSHLALDARTPKGLPVI